MEELKLSILEEKLNEGGTILEYLISEKTINRISDIEKVPIDVMHDLLKDNELWHYLLLTAKEASHVKFVGALSLEDALDDESLKIAKVFVKSYSDYYQTEGFTFMKRGDIFLGIVNDKDDVLVTVVAIPKEELKLPELLLK